MLPSLGRRSVSVVTAVDISVGWLSSGRLMIQYWRRTTPKDSQAEVCRMGWPVPGTVAAILLLQWSGGRLSDSEPADALASSKRHLGVGIEPAGMLGGCSAPRTFNDHAMDFGAIAIDRDQLG